MKKTYVRLAFRPTTVRILTPTDLGAAVGGSASGSQLTLSVTCPPPKNGEGGGCVTK